MKNEHEQMVQDLQRLNRWKQQYLQFMNSIKSTSQMMQSYCQDFH
jgi:sulfur transfer protein SufE